MAKLVGYYTETPTANPIFRGAAPSIRKPSIPRDRHNSLFNQTEIENWICEIQEAIYGKWNKKMWEDRDSYVGTITPENSFWQYPKSADDLQWLTLNQQNWLRFEIFQPEEVPTIEMATAISHQHLVYIIWQPSAFGGIDFFGSTTNIRAAAYAFIDQMMAGMKIRLSAEAQKQLDETR